tara:strand:- start:1121 stop:1729 length:609 start_codon:yes stop_codon:yes gene_type:complete
MRWCEPKFLYSIYIAEFWNSITSLIFCLIGAYGYYNHRNLGISNTPWYLLALIGMTSFLFHLTLSFVGQFLDELSIILLVSYCLKELYDLNDLIYYFILTILSLVSWFFPFASPFIFITSGTCLALSTYVSIKNNEARKLWNYCINTGLFSVLLWGIDFICYINTHMYWHIVVSFSAYLMILYVINNKKNYKISNSYLPILF